MDRAEILDALSRSELDVASFFESLPAEELALRVGEAWTAAEHLQHLCIAVAGLARGFAAPRWLLRLRFRSARRPSRSYPILRDDYRERLERGARATGAFVPVRQDMKGEEIAEARARMLVKWKRVNVRLREAVERWSEAELDRIRLPHPILGLITAREMLFFAIYHAGHHVAAARSRLP